MTTEHQKPTSVASSPAEMTRDEILAMFARRQEAFDDLDAAALAADYADDVVIDSPMSGRHGKAEAERNLRALFDAFLDLKASFEPPIVDGPHVAVIGMCEGTNMAGSWAFRRAAADSSCGPS